MPVNELYFDTARPVRRGGYSVGSFCSDLPAFWPAIGDERRLSPFDPVVGRFHFFVLYFGLGFRVARVVYCCETPSYTRIATVCRPKFDTDQIEVFAKRIIKKLFPPISRLFFFFCIVVLFHPAPREIEHGGFVQAADWWSRSGQPMASRDRVFKMAEFRFLVDLEVELGNRACDVSVSPPAEPKALNSKTRPPHGLLGVVFFFSSTFHVVFYVLVLTIATRYRPLPIAGRIDFLSRTRLTSSLFSVACGQCISVMNLSKTTQTLLKKCQPCGSLCTISAPLSRFPFHESRWTGSTTLWSSLDL